MAYGPGDRRASFHPGRLVCLMRELAHVVRPAHHDLRFRDGRRIGGGSRLELLLRVDGPVDREVQSIVNVARLCHRAIVR